MRLWRNVLAPREHGGWSLALEPLALGLLASRSPRGVFPALAVACLFLSRRPLKLWWGPGAPRERRTAAAWSVAGCLALAAGLLAASAWHAPRGWMLWLLPWLIGGGVFAWLDLGNRGREWAAEVAGAAAFAFTAAAVGAAGGLSAAQAGALAFVAGARSVPTVLLVRTYLRRAKGEPVAADAILALHLGVAVLATCLVIARWLPAPAGAGIDLLSLRAILLLHPSFPGVRARSLGFQELAAGAAFVLAIGLTWAPV